MKYFHCGQNNHATENFFVLHPKKRRSFERKNTFEAKFGALEERFKNLVSSSKILESPVLPGAKAISSTPDYYIFGASVEMENSTAMTRAQSVSRAIPSITREFVKNGPTNQNGLARLLLSFGFGRCYPIYQWS